MKHLPVYVWHNLWAKNRSRGHSCLSLSPNLLSPTPAFVPPRSEGMFYCGGATHSGRLPFSGPWPKASCLDVSALALQADMRVKASPSSLAAFWWPASAHTCLWLRRGSLTIICIPDLKTKWLDEVTDAQVWPSRQGNHAEPFSK